MIYRFFLSAALSLGCATAAFAEEAAPATSAAEAAEASAKSVKDPNEKICTIERMTGSNITKRVCMTRAEREAQIEANRSALELGRTPGAAPGL